MIGQIVGNYKIEQKLGEGGMGAVFRARDAQLERAVAVKVLPEGKLSDAQAVARFRREAKALAQLSHPGIIQAHDSGQDRRVRRHRRYAVGRRRDRKGRRDRAKVSGVGSGHGLQNH